MNRKQKHSLLCMPFDTSIDGMQIPILQHLQFKFRDGLLLLAISLSNLNAQNHLPAFPPAPTMPEIAPVFLVST